MQTKVKFLALAAIAIALGAFVYFGAQDSALGLPPPSEEVDEELVAANTRFAFNLFGELTRTEPGENIFISPTSISLALAMTYNGADGQTREAMAEVLQIADMDLETVNRAFAELRTILQNPDPAVQLDIANSIWAREGLAFKEDFLQRNQQFYEAAIEELDFDDPEASSIINNWVKEQTRDRIEEIVDEDIDPSTVMFLINAIYFNGEWGHKFDPEHTQDASFFLPDGTQVTRPFMHQEDTYRYHEKDSFQAIALPYGEGDRISMYIFLPAEDSSLEDFLGGLNTETWSEHMTAFREMEGEISLPRFTFEYESGLKETLKALGMEVAFDPREADFGAMYPIRAGENLYIEDVKHKTFIDVNEQGTEAAAVTSVEIRMESAMETFQMDMNRPFFFAICDDLTGTILFMGSLVTP